MQGVMRRLTCAANRLLHLHSLGLTLCGPLFLTQGALTPWPYLRHCLWAGAGMHCQCKFGHQGGISSMQSRQAHIAFACLPACLLLGGVQSRQAHIA